MSHEGAARVWHLQPRVVLFPCPTNDCVSYVTTFCRMTNKISYKIAAFLRVLPMRCRRGSFAYKMAAFLRVLPTRWRRETKRKQKQRRIYIMWPLLFDIIFSIIIVTRSWPWIVRHSIMLSHVTAFRPISEAAHSWSDDKWTCLAPLRRTVCMASWYLSSLSTMKWPHSSESCRRRCIDQQDELHWQHSLSQSLTHLLQTAATWLAECLTVWLIQVAHGGVVALLWWRHRSTTSFPLSCHRSHAACIDRSMNTCQRRPG